MGTALMIVWGLIKPVLMKLATSYMVEELFIQLGEELVKRTDSQADDNLLKAAKRSLGRKVDDEDSAD